MTPIAANAVPETLASRTRNRWIGGSYAVPLWVQGLYYLISGLWPLVSIDTFEVVTGTKTDNLATGRAADHWLVMTVAVLITVIAITLLVAAWRRQDPPEAVVLALGSALGLIAIDVIYVARQVIAPIYLLDALGEAVLIAIWIWTLIERFRTQLAKGGGTGFASGANAP